MTIRNQWLKKPQIDNEKLIKLYQEGFSGSQIGKEMGIAKSSVTRRLKKLGVVIRKSSDYAGENRYWLWKGQDYLDPITRKRNQRLHRTWSQEVRKRDGFKCTKCSKHDVDLEAHHIVKIEDCIKSGTEFDVSNGITLCVPCHRKIHKDI